jgi:hypothetical protein
MSQATFNRVTHLVVERAKKEGLPLESSPSRLAENDSTLLGLTLPRDTS